jgi:hypothetical protein
MSGHNKHHNAIINKIIKRMAKEIRQSPRDVRYLLGLGFPPVDVLFWTTVYELHPELSQFNELSWCPECDLFELSVTPSAELPAAERFLQWRALTT